MIFVLESCGAEINQTDFRIQQDAALVGLTVHSSRRRGDLPVVGKGLISIVAEENVLRLQICVDEVEIVKDCRDRVSLARAQESQEIRGQKTYKQHL